MSTTTCAHLSLLERGDLGKQTTDCINQSTGTDICITRKVQSKLAIRPQGFIQKPLPFAGSGSPYLTHLQNLTRLSQLPVTSRMYTFSPSRDPKLLNGAQLTELQPSLESWMKVVCHSSFGWCCRILTRPSLEAHASIKPSSWGAHATLYRAHTNDGGGSRYKDRAHMLRGQATFKTSDSST